MYSKAGNLAGRGKELSFQVVGRLSTLCDLLRPLAVRIRGEKRVSDGHDKTGLVQGERRVHLEHFPGEICLVRYGSLAHTLWRAQELTLIHRHRKFLERPLADYGCGDGSFGAALFSEIDFGIDNDLEALGFCDRHPSYVSRVLSLRDRVPLPTGSLGSVLANSVMEHTLHPEVWLKEISRLIRPGGVFMMTVPLLGFARHLARYFGWKESRRVNKEYHHYNLLEADQWLEWLRAFEFDPTVVLQYQPPSFSFWYRMLRLVEERGSGAFPGVQDRLWRWSRPKLLNMIGESVVGIKDGANLFVVARRR